MLLRIVNIEDLPFSAFDSAVIGHNIELISQLAHILDKHLVDQWLHATNKQKRSAFRRYPW